MSGPSSGFGRHVDFKWHDYQGSYTNTTNVCILRITLLEKKRVEFEKTKDDNKIEMEVRDAQVHSLRTKLAAYRALTTNLEEDEDKNAGGAGGRKRRRGVFKSAPPTHPSKKKMYQNDKGEWVCPNLWPDRVKISHIILA